jgi:capsular polysaccharide export protein
MRYGVCWWKRGMPTLGRLLDAEIVYPPLLGRDIDALLAWGRKRGTARALRWPWAPPRPVVYAEDGFLRSLDLGFRSPPLSVVLDTVGIYYDATQPSGFEALMRAGRGAAERTRAQALAAAWRNERVSKYNHARETPVPVDGPYVLVVDQTFGDASISCGLADAKSFPRMLDAALAEHPGLPVVLKVHPDVVAGHKRGHFDIAALRRAAPRVTVVASDVHPPALLAPAQAVYTVTSQMGFEALLWGKPVRTFGMPFYAGWGLTADDLAAPQRRRDCTGAVLDDLVHAALVQYPRYLDPATGRRGEPEQLVAWIGAQRRARGLAC